MMREMRVNNLYVLYILCIWFILKHNYRWIYSYQYRIIIIMKEDLCGYKTEKDKIHFIVNYKN
jgi:hypothetical protein